MIYLTEKEVAVMTKMSVFTLRNNRSNGKGIDYCKFGKSIRYREDDVHKFMQNHLVKVSPDKRYLWRPPDERSSE